MDTEFVICEVENVISYTIEVNVSLPKYKEK